MRFIANAILTALFISWFGVAAQNEGLVFRYNEEIAPPVRDDKGWRGPQDVVNANNEFLQFKDALKEQSSDLIKMGPASSCDDLYSQGVRKDGPVFILLDDIPTKVYCQFNGTDDNWLVFQKRFNGNVDFYKTYNEYVEGFGDIDDEFWLGLETIHKITYANTHRLRIELESFEGEIIHLDYSTFAVADAESRFILTVRGFSGPRGVGDAFSRQHRHRFSAKDADHDTWDGNCSVERHGGWWYGGCSLSNLNGRYVNSGKPDFQGMMWFLWKRSIRSMKSSVMKIQPVAKRSFS